MSDPRPQKVASIQRSVARAREEELAADVPVLNLSMRGGGGLDALPHLHARFPQAQRARARGFLAARASHVKENRVCAT
jgi:DNA-binding NarL/FixJ family response regulator